MREEMTRAAERILEWTGTAVNSRRIREVREIIDAEMGPEITRIKKHAIKCSDEFKKACMDAVCSKERAENLESALQHMRWCQSCAEGAWSDCAEGRKAEALLGIEVAGT